MAGTIWTAAQAKQQELISSGTIAPILAERYYAVDYLHEGMTLALAAADLAVARAGASVLGEFPVAGLPSVLVPLAIAGGHQHLNAELLANQNAAVIIADDRVNDELGPAVFGLLRDSERRAAMSAAAARLANPWAANNIAAQLVELAAT